MGRAEPADGAFQSSPGPKTGCHEALHIGILHTYRVSILTRPEDRVPPYIRTLKGATQCFNPHPARRPGATVHTHTQRSYAMFQSSPGPKTGCHRTYAHSKELRNVSILTRPEDRVPPYIRTLKGATQCFNPHPARRPGATPSRLVLAPIGMCFNPHPARRPGATYTKKGLVVVEDVFQSSPGPKTGCHSARPLSPRRRVWSFNPHPARRPGATRSTAPVFLAVKRFNPHPARRPGATA